MSSPQTDATHDPALRSWVDSANAPDHDFPIQNLPFGRFRSSTDTSWRLGVAIGDEVLDLRAAARAGLELPESLSGDDLGPFMALGPQASRKVRQSLSAALMEGSACADVLRVCLVPRTDVQMGLPCTIGGYSDFFTGVYHASSGGKLANREQPLTPNYKWVPIAYHGRTSSIVPTGTPVRRPYGQFLDDDGVPKFGPCKRLDYELEVGVLMGRGNAQGEPVDIAVADEHWFGLVLLNDWSARDIQRWESQPLGPFLAKSFATSISPWVVTREALEPFRVPAKIRDAEDPVPLPYLYSETDARSGGIDVQLEAWLQTPEMSDPERLMESAFSESAYWTVAQMIAHHTSNGCNLSPGDLLGTGTQSGPNPDQGGCLMELTRRGSLPIRLPNGQVRTFLEDGDQVTLRAHCRKAGWRSIGFGDCAGLVAPPIAR